MTRFRELLILLGEELSLHPPTDSENDEYRQILMAAIMDNGYINQLKVCIRVSVMAKSRIEGREVTQEEILAELFNSMTQGGDVNGIDVVAKIDKQHICGN